VGHRRRLAEYQTGQGRADFALCHHSCKTAIFVEVNNPSKAEEAFHHSPIWHGDNRNQLT